MGASTNRRERESEPRCSGEFGLEVAADEPSSPTGKRGNEVSSRRQNLGNGHQQITGAASRIKDHRVAVKASDEWRQRSLG
jgi:hypothetical protein